MAGERADVVRGVEDEVGLAEIDGRAERAEDGERDGVELLAVIEEEAEAGIEFVAEGDDLFELGAAVGEFDGAPDILAAGQGFEGLQGGAAFDLGFRLAEVFQAGLGDFDPAAGAEGDVMAVFVLDHRVGFQQVREGGGDVADAVAGGLAEPDEQAFVQGAGRVTFDLQAFRGRGRRRPAGPG